MPLLTIEEPPRAPLRGFALWALGFRPFYLLAAIDAALSVPLWALQVAGRLPHAYLRGPLWHAHEMLFGFTLAVIVGFLFTAVRQWTQRPTPTGKALAAIAALWVAARVLVLTPYAWPAAAANVAFPLAAAVAIGVPLVASRNRRNQFFVALLVLFAVAAGVFHLALMADAPALGRRAVGLALDGVLFILAVMGGRVIPMFTNNGVPGANARRQPVLERASLGLVLAMLALDAAGATGAPAAAVAAAAAVAHALRWLGWQPWKTGSKALVWSLHLAYAWLPVHLALRAFAEAGLVTTSAATHALTVGAAGGLVIAMITRTAKGHTGRALRADRLDTACYLLVFAAALVRVWLPAVAPAHTIAAILGSAFLWSAGFGLYAVGYFAPLTRPRQDGKPG